MSGEVKAGSIELLRLEAIDGDALSTRLFDFFSQIIESTFLLVNSFFLLDLSFNYQTRLVFVLNSL